MEQIITSFIANSPTAGAIILVVWMMQRSAERAQDAYLTLIKQELNDQMRAITEHSVAIQKLVEKIAGLGCIAKEE